MSLADGSIPGGWSWKSVRVPTVSIRELPPYPNTPGLSWRGLEAIDLEAWLALIMRIQDFDKAQERTTMADLQTLPRQSWVDLAADFLVGVDADGEFRAVGRNAFRPGIADEIAVTLVGGVDPAWRGRGVGTALLGWQLCRADQNIAHLRASDPAAQDLPGRIRGGVEEQIRSLQRLYEANGFSPVRWFTELRKQLTQDGGTLGASGPGHPGHGLELVPLSGDWPMKSRSPIMKPLPTIGDPSPTTANHGRRMCSRMRHSVLR